MNTRDDLFVAERYTGKKRKSNITFKMCSIKVYINKLTVPPTLMVNLVGPNPLNLCLAKKTEEHGYSMFWTVLSLINHGSSII